MKIVLFISSVLLVLASPTAIHIDSFSVEQNLDSEINIISGAIHDVHDISRLVIQKSTNGVSFHDIREIDTPSEIKEFHISDSSSATTYYRLQVADTENHLMIKRVIAAPVSKSVNGKGCSINAQSTGNSNGFKIPTDCDQEDGVIEIDMLDVNGEPVHGSIPVNYKEDNFRIKVDKSNNFAPCVLILKTKKRD